MASRTMPGQQVSLLRLPSDLAERTLIFFLSEVFQRGCDDTFEGFYFKKSRGRK